MADTTNIDVCGECMDEQIAAAAVLDEVHEDSRRQAALFPVTAGLVTVLRRSMPELHSAAERAEVVELSGSAVREQ